jgi:hypothetical protein
VTTKELIITPAIAVAADLTGPISSLFMPGIPSHDDEVSSSRRLRRAHGETHGSKGRENREHEIRSAGSAQAMGRFGNPEMPRIAAAR